MRRRPCGPNSGAGGPTDGASEEDRADYDTKVVHGRRILWRSIVAVVALVFSAVAVAHLPPVRARVLAMVLARLGESGITARVDRLDYNLITRTIAIYGVTLANAAVTAAEKNAFTSRLPLTAD